MNQKYTFIAICVGLSGLSLFYLPASGQADIRETDRFYRHPLMSDTVDELRALSDAESDEEFLAQLHTFDRVVVGEDGVVHTESGIELRKISYEDNFEQPPEPEVNPANVNDKVWQILHEGALDEGELIELVATISRDAWDSA